jgi:serine/threonine-protein kinase RsbW
MSADEKRSSAPERDFQLCLEETMAGDVNAISALVQRVSDLLTERGIVRGHEAEISLALQEALANGVRYGTKGDPTKTIYLGVFCGRKRGVRIVVRDPGPGFNPDSVPSPMTEDGLVSDHGRGLYMIKALLDEVHWEKNGTEIHLTKY